MADDIKISPDMINNLVNMLKNNNENNNSNKDNNNAFKDEDSSNFTNNVDFETIMKIKSIMENLNYKDDPDSNLLYSLKPYLRKSRQEKLDQYVNILKISRISKMFKL